MTDLGELKRSKRKNIFSINSTNSRNFTERKKKKCFLSELIERENAKIGHFIFNSFICSKWSLMKRSFLWNRIMWNWVVCFKSNFVKGCQNGSNFWLNWSIDPCWCDYFPSIYYIFIPLSYWGTTIQGNALPILKRLSPIFYFCNSSFSCT